MGKNQQSMGLPFKKKGEERGSSVKGKMVTSIQQCVGKCLTNGYQGGGRALVSGIFWFL